MRGELSEHPVRQTMSLDSSPLIERAQSGDAQAFHELVAPHMETVRRMARSFCRDWSDADDIAQEALIKAFRSIGTYRQEAKFSTWLYQVTKNSCIDWYRSKMNKAREREGEELDAPMDSSSNQEHLLRARERADALWDAIRSLDATFRVPLVLFEIEGTSYEDIARIEGVPVGTIRSRLNRAKKHLLAHLEKTDEFARVTPLPELAGTSESEASSDQIRGSK